MAHILDYVGFTYDGIHSSSLKILRTSTSGRYTHNLYPDLEDSSTSVPGGDGQYYFGSQYRGQNFTVSFAYDSLLEKDIRRIKLLFTGKGVHQIIFDELPYKVYYVKPTGNAAFKYMPFEEGPDGRLYKGEGTINFIAYTPYARSRYKWKNEYTQANIPEWTNAEGNLNEWIESSGIVNKGYYDTFVNRAYPVYNPGDVDTDFMLDIPFNSDNIGGANGVSFYLEGTPYMLNTGVITPRTSEQPAVKDTFLRLNSKLYVLEGLNAQKKQTGNLYNEYITSGDFFKIPMGGESQFVVTGADPTNIEYDFLYI